MPATTIDNNATSFDALVADIDAANAEAAGTGSYVIDIDGALGPIALTGALPEIKLQTGVTLDIVGENGATLDGQGAEPGLYVYEGAVSISDLTIQNAVAQGQAGTRYYNGGGGGHAGLGGGLFVGSQAAVTLDQVTFKADAAIGGNGGAGVTYAYSDASTGARPGRGGNSGFYYSNGVATSGHPGQTGSFGQGGGGGGGGVGGFTFGVFRADHGGEGGAGGFGGGAGAAGSPGVATKYTYYSTSHKHQITVPTYTYASHNMRITTTTRKDYTNSIPGNAGKGGSGGGGLGAGGDVYVQGGGTLQILGGSLSGTATGGTGGNAGAGLGGSIFLQGTETLHLDPGAGQTLTVEGSIADEAGYDSNYSADTGKVVIDGAGTVKLNAASTFAGGITLSDGTLELGAQGAAGKGGITFGNPAAVDPTIVVDAAATPGDGQTFANPIVGFGPGDAIDLRGLGYKAGATAQLEPANSSIVDVTSNGVTVKLTLTDPQSSNTYVVKDDRVLNPATGKDGVIVEVPCYCRGTLIRTETGDVPVEQLAVGDRLVTASGDLRPVRWTGHRTLDITRHPDPEAVWPVRVRAGAFAESVPSRDLWMSPGHRVFVDGGLLAIRYLINGTTIVQEQRDTVTYWHVELDGHDVILAEGLAAESYLDTGNRTAFENGGAYLELHPDFETLDSSDACAPLIKLGPQVEAIKERLGERIPLVGFVGTTEHDLHLVADGTRIEPIDIGNRRFAFALPAGTTTIDLVSRTFIPRYGDPKSKDDRALGLLVKRLEIDGTDVDLAAIDATLGWHKLEGAPGQAHRWTTGRTRLPAGSRIVVLDLVRGGRYWIERRDNLVTLAA